MKTKNKSRLSPLLTKRILGSICAVLVFLCLLLLIALRHQYELQRLQRASFVGVSLGTLEYTYADGKATRHPDANTEALQRTLTAAAHKDIQLGCQASYYHVEAYNEAKTQVYLKYGCTSADSPMYAVRSGATWKLLSPTNRFDTFDIPDCDYLAQNAIDPKVAPVCVSGWLSPTPEYRVR